MQTISFRVQNLALRFTRLTRGWLTPSIIALIAIALIWALNTPWYACLSRPDKLSFWVAVGTGCLALATFASVLETSLILRGEDIRHQESYAPILTVDYFEDWRRGIGFFIRNTGLGPALKIRLVVQAQVEWYRKTSADAWEMESADPLDKNENLLYIIHAPGSREFVLGQLGFRPGLERSMNFKSVVLEYEDVFGNPYSTKYTDVKGQAYDWTRPKIRRR